jgi:two-component system, chemotaxis family, protein-glutamate methylesterase/glutaminase
MHAHVKRVVVIGASSGGVDALRTIVSALPRDFPAPICVVVHTAPQSPGVLDGILRRVGTLPAQAARSGEPLRPGRIYVGPPDHHLVLEPGILRLTKGPRENRFRPAIDPLFRSTAQVYGPSAIGVVLTGNLDDGAAGLWTIKQLGGTAIVQDPDNAEYPSMPLSALNTVEVDHCVPLAALAPLLTRLVADPAAAHAEMAVPEQLDIELRIAKEENAVDAGVKAIGEPSSYACPECHGVLLRLKEGKLLRFRCHTGHAYSAASLVAAIQEGIEEAVWNAVRALEEGGLLLQHLATHLEETGHTDAARDYAARAVEARRQSEKFRAVVEKREAFEPIPQDL